MSYSIDRECIARIGQDALTEYHGGTYDAAKLKASRAEAASIIDLYLGRSEPVPIDTSDDDALATTLRRCELCIVEFLEASRPDNPDVSARIKDAHNQAMEWLASVRDGKVQLRPPVTAPPVSVRKLRGEVAKPVLCCLEFNATTTAAGDPEAEYRDTGQAHWIAPWSGEFFALAFRAYDPMNEDAEVAIRPTINDVVVADEELWAEWSEGIQRGLMRPDSVGAGYRFERGDRLGLSLVSSVAGDETAAPDDALVLKVWIWVQLDLVEQ